MAVLQMTKNSMDHGLEPLVDINSRLSMRMLPPRADTAAFTTSSPTPLPENSVALLFVVNPGRSRNA